MLKLLVPQARRVVLGWSTGQTEPHMPGSGLTLLLPSPAQPQLPHPTSPVLGSGPGPSVLPPNAGFKPWDPMY